MFASPITVFVDKIESICCIILNMIHDISPFINLPDVHSRRIDIVDRVPGAVGVGVDGGVLLPERVGVIQHRRSGEYALAPKSSHCRPKSGPWPSLPEKACRRGACNSFILNHKNLMKVYPPLLYRDWLSSVRQYGFELSCEIRGSSIFKILYTKQIRRNC